MLPFVFLLARRGIKKSVFECERANVSLIMTRATRAMTCAFFIIIIILRARVRVNALAYNAAGERIE